MVAAVAMTAVGCARTQAPGREAPRARAPLSDPGPLAEAWRLPARIVDGETGEEISEQALVDQLDDARVVYVAERHDSPHDHAVQLAVIHALHQRDPSIGIGMEMFKRPFQKWVTDYVEGEIDEAEMLEKTEWDQRWGFDFALYRPILEYAREHRIPIYALNARDEITRQVARRGLAALDPVDRDAVPELDLTDEAHRSVIQEVFDAHGMGASAHGGMDFENFYTAQVIWDETMAHEVARELSSDGAPRRMVVLAGGGHIRFGMGIPSRAARRGAEPFLTVYPKIEKEDAGELVGTGLADYLWLMSHARAED